MPQRLLRVGGALTLKSAEMARLLDSLVIDDSRIRNELFWSPSITMQQGLNRTIEWMTGRPATPRGCRATVACVADRHAAG